MSKLKATAKAHKAQFNERIPVDFRDLEILTPAKLHEKGIIDVINTEPGWMVYEAMTVYKPEEGKYVTRTKQDGTVVFGYTVYLPCKSADGQEFIVKDNNYDTTTVFASTISLDDEDVIAKEAVRAGEDKFCLVYLQDTFEGLFVLGEAKKTQDGRKYTAYRIDSEE